MERLWQFLGLGVALVAAGPAFAQGGRAERPPSCVPVLTIQYTGCYVKNVWTCPDMGQTVWWTENSDLQGLLSIKTFTKDFLEATTYFPRTEIRMELDLSQSASTSPAEVVRTGTGVERVRGAVEMKGRSLSLFGYHDIRRVDPPLQVEGGTLIGLRFYGTDTFTPPLQGRAVDMMNYYEPRTGVLMAGESLLPGPDGTVSLTGRPAALAFPDQPGFGATVPGFDCPNLSLYPTDEKAFPT